MADAAIEPRGNYGQGIHVFEHYSAGALTAATLKYEWIVPFNCSIIDVLADSEGANGGTDDDILDVNRNGTTIFGTQANRPTLTADDTGAFTVGKWSVTELRAGDVLSYDVDAVGATGSTRFKLAVVVAKR